MKNKYTEEVQEIINHYQYGNIMFIEAVQCIINKCVLDKITRDEAEKAIKQISRIKLPY